MRRDLPLARKGRLHAVQPLRRATPCGRVAGEHRSRVRPEGFLGSYAGLIPVNNTRERGKHAVAGRFDYLSFIVFDCLAQDRVVACQSCRHCCGKFLPHTRARLEIGEEQHMYGGHYR